MRCVARAKSLTDTGPGMVFQCGTCLQEVDHEETLRRACLTWNVFRRGDRFVPDNTLPVELQEVLAGARVEVANRWRNIDNALETLAGGLPLPTATWQAVHSISNRG
jgi:hypothetical protein